MKCCATWSCRSPDSPTRHYRGSGAIGPLAAIGFVLYFLSAIIMHVRAKDSGKGMGPALILLVLSVVVRVLQVIR
ncbi:MAG: hypothetical protein EXQ60_08040 [Candidatus Nanopelagicales bacterium]|nr:hypothetical protein [Candidatus Nanopelagicales bacterium]